MAFDFPASPTVGQLFMPGAGVSYIFNGSGWVLSSGASVQASDFGFRATKGGTDQTGIGAAVDTKLTFTTEELDRGGYYDAPNSRWTPPAGYVHLTALVNFGGTAGGITHYLGIAKNGVVQKRHYMMVGTGEGGFGGIETAFDDYANGNDYYEVYYRVEGVAGTLVYGNILYTYFQGHITGGRGPQGPQGTVQSGALILIQSQIVSSPVASVDFTGIDATYDEYEIHVLGFQPSVAAWLALRFSQDGGATFKAGGADYGYVYFGFLASNTASNFGSNGSSMMFIGASDIFVGAQYSGSYRINLYRLSSTILRKHISWIGTGSGSGATWSGSGGGTYFIDTNAVNALRFISSVAGNITAGIFNLYGIKR